MCACVCACTQIVSCVNLCVHSTMWVRICIGMCAHMGVFVHVTHIYPHHSATRTTSKTRLVEQL